MSEDKDYGVKPEFIELAKEILEKHKDTFKKLAEYEAKEKQDEAERNEKRTVGLSIVPKES